MSRRCSRSEPLTGISSCRIDARQPIHMYSTCSKAVIINPLRHERTPEINHSCHCANHTFNNTRPKLSVVGSKCWPASWLCFPISRALLGNYNLEIQMCKGYTVKEYHSAGSMKPNGLGSALLVLISIR